MRDSLKDCLTALRRDHNEFSTRELGLLRAAWDAAHDKYAPPDPLTALETVRGADFYKELAASVLGRPVAEVVPGKEAEAVPAMVYIAGKRFACRDCSVTVFSRTGDLFVCNGCGAVYEGTRSPA
jgi:hypothetical protein